MTSLFSYQVMYFDCGNNLLFFTICSVQKIFLLFQNCPSITLPSIHHYNQPFHSQDYAYVGNH